jgi:hypothetical protein
MPPVDRDTAWCPKNPRLGCLIIRDLFAKEFCVIIRPFKAGDLVVECKVGPNFALLSALPGRHKWIERKFIFKPTGASIAYIIKNWPEAQWIEGAEVNLKDFHDARILGETVSAQKKIEEWFDDGGHPFKTKPFDHQLKAFLISRDMSVFALFHEQGCGKSKVVVDTTAYLYTKEEVDTLIVIAPNGVHTNWILNEIPAHLLGDIPAWTGVYKASLKPKEYLELMEAATKEVGKLRIITFNVEGFISSKAKALMEHWLKNSKAIMVVDESQRIKSHGAERTKYLTKVGRKAKYRRILTGTPVTRGVENLFSQFRFLDPMIIGHDTFTAFRSEYCVMGGFENRSIVAYQNLPELIARIDGYSHRVLKKDCLDLPDKTYKRHPFEMEKFQRMLYDQVRTSALDELEKTLGLEKGQEMAKAIAITKLLRLQQIACGWFPEAQPRPLPHNPRMEALDEVIEDAGDGKIIIWSRFVADIQVMAKKFGEHALTYYGATSTKDREFAVKAFQDKSNRKKFFISNKAGSTGLTLTAALNAIYYSNDFDLETRLQGEDRNHRIGTEGTVVYTDLEAEKSIDRKIINALRKKKSIADMVTQDPISMFME